jgi:hypothetical protein
LLRLEVIHVVFSNLASRLEEAQRWVVHVASPWWLRLVEAEDGWVDAMGYIRPFYPKVVVFYVFGPRGNLVF